MLWPSVVERHRDHRSFARRQMRRKGGQSLPARLKHPYPVCSRRGGEARRRLSETNETRACVDAGQLPPLGGVHDLEPLLGRVVRGSIIDARSLLDVGVTVSSIEETRRFIERIADRCPHLADLGGPLEPFSELTREIDRCIDPGGEILDTASRALERARRDTTRLSGELQQRLNRYLQSRDITPHLSDVYFTVRNDRYVLPVRADARSKVKGIVHDASRSGTTLFIEPEGVIDLNNRLKEAELTVVSERERILRTLSLAVAEQAAPIRRSLAAMGRIDLAFARGRWSYDTMSVEPEVGEEGIFELPGLRHPLLPSDECVANDLRLGADFTVLVL